MNFIAEKGQSPVLHVLYIDDIEISLREMEFTMPYATRY